MALFEKNSEIDAFLKRLQSGAVSSPEELKELCEYVFAHPDVELHEAPWLFTHPKKMVRQYAARRAHQSLRPGRLVESLLAAMASADAELRRELARLVGELVADRLSEYLPDLIHAGEVAKREIAIDLIAKSAKIIDHLSAIKVLLRDDASKIRQRAVKLLARDPDNPTVFMILRGLIHDENEAIRTIVIDTLSKRPDPEVIEPFFERLAVEGCDLRSQIIGALKRLARDRSVRIEDRILPMLADEIEDVREVAIELLKELPDPLHTLRAFILHSQGLASWLRDRAIKSICRVCDDVIDPLCILLADEDERVKVGAMAIAKGSRDRRVLAPLAAIVDSQQDWWIRGVAVEIFGQFPSDDVTAFLVHFIGEPDLKFSIIDALSHHANDLAIDTLLGCLGDSCTSSRLAALEALSHHKVPRVVDALQTVALDDRTDAVVAKATEILEKFGAMDRHLRQEIDELRVQGAGGGSELDGQLSMVNDALNS